MKKAWLFWRWEYDLNNSTHVRVEDMPCQSFSVLLVACDKRNLYLILTGSLKNNLLVDYIRPYEASDLATDDTA